MKKLEFEPEGDPLKSVSIVFNIIEETIQEEVFLIFKDSEWHLIKICEN